MLNKVDCMYCGYEFVSLRHSFSDPLPMEENLSPALTGYRTWGRNVLSAGQVFFLDTFALVHRYKSHDCRAVGQVKRGDTIRIREGTYAHHEYEVL